ncbi:hypothetical protein [Nocardia cyriacigeorgica]|uniref:hypothetical protein n=1 Tax=Nocardia cyriacigeorgica TaxID=135487 RepID=UPI00189492AE|nr:hypothetical protein [Nocardia cyriacigeorgica]MBF6087186.1 hypothetical protein [Nocardia cyriacigeorgica]
MVLTVLAIAIILVLAFLSGAEKPPSRSTNLLISLVAVLFQSAAAWMFNGVGRADPTHVQASARRVIAFGRQVAATRRAAEAAFEQENPRPTAAQYKTQMGILSAELSKYEDDAIGFVEDWRLVNEQAVERAGR